MSNVEEIRANIIKSLNSKSFWDKCEIRVSPADGHCLIHSVVSSVNSQIGNEVYFEMSDILEAIQTETITHMDEYVEFLEADSKDMVWDYMENYVHH